MLHVEVIKTGNEGNCYLITTDNPRFKDLKTSIMVDYGGYFLEKRDYSDLCAICLTHCHKDHVSGMAKLQKLHNYNLPVIGTYDELNAPNVQRVLGIRRGKDVPLIYIEFPEIMQKSTPICMGNFVIFAARAYHDTACPVHYWITDGEKSVFIGCDTSNLDDVALHLLEESDIVLIESNYSRNVIRTNMIDGKRVEVVFVKSLKERIITYGHLSNQDIFSILPHLANAKLIVLTHINEVLNSRSTMEREIGKSERIKFCFAKDCPMKFVV